MSQYKHYSFDLWLTLIKYNPEFKQKRAEYLYHHFNRNNIPLSEVSSIIREVDVMCNNSNEIVGKNIDAFEMYTMVLYRMGYNLSLLTYRDIQSVYHTIESIFFKYPPVLYSEETMDVLYKLKREGATLSILSNTGFIKGFTLKNVLVELGILQLFSFTLFSDEYGLSKPNNHFYLLLLNAVNKHNKHTPVKQNEILHVGDNEIADYKGAKDAGIDSLLINSNSKTIKHLL